jgi:hypothetical protein
MDPLFKPECVAYLPFKDAAAEFGEAYLAMVEEINQVKVTQL